MEAGVVGKGTDLGRKGKAIKGERIEQMEMGKDFACERRYFPRKLSATLNTLVAESEASEFHTR